MREVVLHKRQGRLTLDEEAQRIARSGGPPETVPETLDDMEAIRKRWPELVVYDQATGDLVWRYWLDRIRLGEPVMPQTYLAGKRVRGRTHKVVRIDGFVISTARVVWLLHHGAWPVGRIGRHDGDEFNDRIGNLFDMGAGTRERPGRKRKNPVGVARLHDRWQAYAPLPNGKRKHLGVFRTVEAATAAREAWDAAQDLV